MYERFSKNVNGDVWEFYYDEEINEHRAFCSRLNCIIFTATDSDINGEPWNDNAKEAFKIIKNKLKEIKNNSRKEDVEIINSLGVEYQGIKGLYTLRLPINLIVKIKSLNINKTSFITMAILEKLEKENL